MNLGLLINKCAGLCCVIVGMLVFNNGMQAQLRADFTVDKTGGCSPLTVSFTNRSTGTSSNTVYKWDFGNGNTAIIASPGAIYTDEKVYTVTLTATDGTQSSVKTQQITVYSKPQVDFSSNIAKGCLPLNVTFTSNTTPGSGSIASYYWDFGDGSTQQGAGNQQHLYTAQQLATVSLTVTNSHGCHTTAVKKDIVRIIPRLTAGFSSDKQILCRESDAVQFTNSSAGPGTLTYLWDFGDGTTATERNPAHVFNRRGIYTVKLTVTSSEGCVVSETQSGYINVATFSTDFTTPGQICSERSEQFSSISSPTPNNTLWEVNDQVYSWYGNYFSYYFAIPGTYKIKLTNTYGTCVDSAVKTLTVKPAPTSVGFIATIKGQCGAPVAVDFRDTTANAVAWQWNFDWNNMNTVHSTVQAPSYTFNQNRIYHVLLRVTNSSGCTKDVVQPVNIPYPTVHIIYTQSSGGTSACGPITMKFASTTTETITQYRWDFGDGGTSTVAEPEYTFSRPGTWQVRLNYTTANGCTGIAFFNAVTIYAKPTANFSSMSGTNICGNTPTVFSNQSTGVYHGVNWFVNGNSVGAANFSNMVYKFQDEGKYTIKLIVYNGQCSDTIEKVDYVQVSPPFPQITSVENTCDGTRGEVKINHTSKQAQSYTWDFGDGTNTTLTTAHDFINHTYTRTGTYKIVLSTTNGACTVRDSTIVHVMLKKDVSLTVPPSICVGAALPYTLGSLQDNPYPDYWQYNYYFAKWEYEDGTQFNGWNNAWNIVQFPTFSSSISQPDPSKQKIRVILNSVQFNCPDTSNFAPIQIVGPQAALDIVNNNVCFNTPVTFRDVSVTTGSNIVRRTWDFGDGQVQTSTGTSITHTYPSPGMYYVTLSLLDDKGCTGSTASYTKYVTIKGPRAAFFASGTNVALNTTVSFYNNTYNYGDYNTVYNWDFGDGGTSTQYSPSYTFTRAGTYTVKLSVTNAVTGCSSEATQVIVVKNFNTAFNFNSSFITSQSCPPVLVRFNNTSVNYIRVTWDFGDGITADNVNYPSHIYEKPGKYIITLYGYGPNGLTGTHIDSIVIEEPKATLHADDLEGCIGNMVTLFAKADSTRSYVWDFGDGYVVNTTDTFFAHQYNVPGVYTPKLLVKNAGGCSSFASMNDKITIRPNPTVGISPNDPIVCLGTATQLNATGGVTYSWSPATGLNNSAIASPMASPVTNTTYTVEVADDIGCKSNGSINVKVVAPVIVSLPPDLSVCSGNSVVLPANGAVLYNWINNTTGLNDTDIPNPTATPAITTTYTVTGSDIHKCFTDTAEVTVRVLPLPTVNAGVDVEVQAGTPVNLSPTYSNDVIEWTWSPPNYLNCYTCPAPVSIPLAQTQYILTVKNNVGCFAKDSMLIKMTCDEAKVAIPNAFTPNGDGKNDEFVIKGISLIKHMIIYNRWGQRVFERNNFIAADRAACWDGTLNGYPASPGTYVYFIEMQCPTGGAFTRKGSFVLVR